jgi:AbrB family looped-hinge helix DNA binding protein
MKEFGIVRRIDNLGRVVLPIHLRKKINLSENDDVEISLNNLNQIVISKYNSLTGMSKLFDNIAISIFQVLKGTVLIIDLEKIITSYGLKSFTYKKSEQISNEIIKRIQIPNVIPNIKIISSLVEENNIYLHPLIGRNGKEIGAIIYIYEKDLLENVSNIISSYAIFISEMLKDA